MTEKRFYIAESKLIDGYCVFDREKKYAFTPKPRKADCLNDAHTLNKFNDENEQLKTQLQNTSDQRDEFHRGARENANRVGKLEKENEHLRNRLTDWHQRTFKAHEYFNILEEVIDEVCNDDISNQIWKEYEKREKLVE